MTNVTGRWFTCMVTSFFCIFLFGKLVVAQNVYPSIKAPTLSYAKLRQLTTWYSWFIRLRIDGPVVQRLSTLVAWSHSQNDDHNDSHSTRNGQDVFSEEGTLRIGSHSDCRCCQNKGAAWNVQRGSSLGAWARVVLDCWPWMYRYYRRPCKLLVSQCFYQKNQTKGLELIDFLQR